MEIINQKLLADLADQAMQSPRLHKSYNFHQSLDDLCHRMLNALEPNSVIFECKEGPFVEHEVEILEFKG